MIVKMIDIETRSKAASLLKRVLDEEITNYQLEDQWPASKSDKLFLSADRALPTILAMLMLCYNETPEKQLNRDIFENCEEGLLERCILFLESQYEYQWSNFPFIRIKIPIIDNWFGLEKKWQKRFEEFKSQADFDVWPFFHRGDYEQELAKQK